MPKGIKYGQKAPSVFKQDAKRPVGPSQQPASNLVPAQPIDLYYLSRQDIRNDPQALKRYFLTAFVPPQDLHLLKEPTDAKAKGVIQARLESMGKIFNMPANQGAGELPALKENMIALFKSPQWLGVALRMVDEGSLSIDQLNSLMQWQAAYLQWGEKVFNLELIDNSHPLPYVDTESKRDFAADDLVAPTVFQKLAQYSFMTDDEFRNTEFGKQNSNVQEYLNASGDPKRVGPDGKLTLDTLRGLGFIRFARIGPDNKDIKIYCPSSSLLEYSVNKLGSYILPVYSLGYLAYEDFCASTFCGARIKQAFLPDSAGNLLTAHDTYLGESLASMHDDAHLIAYKEVSQDKETLSNSLQILAIVANAYSRGDDKNQKFSNDLIDGGDISFFCTRLKINAKAGRNNEQSFLNEVASVYKELAITQGLPEPTVTVKIFAGNWLKINVEQNEDLLELTLSPAQYNTPSKLIENFTEHKQAIGKFLSAKENLPVSRPVISSQIFSGAKNPTKPEPSPKQGSFNRPKQ